MYGKSLKKVLSGITFNFKIPVKCSVSLCSSQLWLVLHQFTFELCLHAFLLLLWTYFYLLYDMRLNILSCCLKCSFCVVKCWKKVKETVMNQLVSMVNVCLDVEVGAACCDKQMLKSGRWPLASLINALCCLFLFSKSQPCDCFLHLRLFSSNCSCCLLTKSKNQDSKLHHYKEIMTSLFISTAHILYSNHIAVI